MPGDVAHDAGAYSWLTRRFFSYYPLPKWWGTDDDMPLRVWLAWDALERGYAASGPIGEPT